MLGNFPLSYVLLNDQVCLLDKKVICSGVVEAYSGFLKKIYGQNANTLQLSIHERFLPSDLSSTTISHTKPETAK